jgi:hypothetical protein
MAGFMLFINMMSDGYIGDPNRGYLYSAKILMLTQQPFYPIQIPKKQLVISL